MAQSNNYYDVLGVAKKASQADIKKAYRRLARKFHPDINPGDSGAEERFKKIQEAYSVLSDEEKRKAYDRFGDPRAAGAKGFEGFGDFQGFQGFETGGGGRGFSSFGDIFSDLFGGGRRGAAAEPPQPRAGADLEYHVSIPFLDAIRGTQNRISFSRHAPCDTCGGTGSRSRTSTVRCSTCEGRGQLDQRHGAMRFSSTCPACGGSGTRRVGDCPACGGTGSTQKVEKVSVRIPAGVNTGSRVRVPRKGNAGSNGGPPGDLFLVVKVQPHPVFSREGNDIRCRIPVTLTEAALGAKVEVPTIDGKAWLTIPAGTQSGQKFRLRGRGAPSLKGGRKGDEIIEVQVVLPTFESERSRELLEELGQLEPQNPRQELGLR